jgi:hypothetical protein
MGILSFASSVVSSPLSNARYERRNQCAATGDVDGNQQPQPQSRDDQDAWGHFIDTAEAEDEMIRHSKILSARYASIQ